MEYVLTGLVMSRMAMHAHVDHFGPGENAILRLLLRVLRVHALTEHVFYANSIISIHVSVMMDFLVQTVNVWFTR